MFTVIEGATVVTKCRGIFRQGKMYERGGRIYAQWSSGFIAITKTFEKIATSIPDVSVDEYDLPVKHKFIKTGAMVLEHYVEPPMQTAAEVNAIINGGRK